MVDQLPNLGREKVMLETLGLESIDDLFSDIPESVRMNDELPLPAPQTEEEIIADARRLLGANVALGDRVSFLGAGLNRNYVPASVFQLVTRGEFLTSYTPYQPEVSQGMLQAMWEFQTLISELVGLEVSNLSVYDASTAAAEALTCSIRIHNKKATQKDTVYISELVPPPARVSVIENYSQGGGVVIKTIKHNEDGTLNLESLAEAAGSCGVYVEQPNPLGILDGGLSKVKEIIGQNTAFIVGVSPVSLGLVEAPGNYGADIVVGEGQSLGSPITYGGRYTVFLLVPKIIYDKCQAGLSVNQSMLMEMKRSVSHCQHVNSTLEDIEQHPISAPTRLSSL